MQVTGIIVEHPLQNFGMHEGPVKERRGHGINEEKVLSANTPGALINAVLVSAVVTRKRFYLIEIY